MYVFEWVKKLSGYQFTKYFCKYHTVGLQLDKVSAWHSVGSTKLTSGVQNCFKPNAQKIGNGSGTVEAMHIQELILDT